MNLVLARCQRDPKINLLGGSSRVLQVSVGTLCCEGKSEGGEEPFALASGPSGLCRRGQQSSFCSRGHFRSGQSLRGFLLLSSAVPLHLGCSLSWGVEVTHPAGSRKKRWGGGGCKWRRGAELRGVEPIPQKALSEVGTLRCGICFGSGPEVRSHPLRDVEDMA